jgi:hypothetical protein
MASKTSRAGDLAERLVTNRYAQENIRDAVEQLRAAYARASKRRVRPAEDAKLRAQVNRAATSIGEAVSAVRTGRQKPQPRRGRRLLLIVGVGAVGAAIALAASEELREAVFGGGSDDLSSTAAANGAPATEATVAA